jgi:gluconolactonase
MTADAAAPQIEGEVERIATGFNSPEGPAFDRNGNLYFVNWLTSAIIRLSPGGAGGAGGAGDSTWRAEEFTNTGGIPAGLAFHPDGTLYVADEGDQWHGVLRVSPSGAITPWMQEYEGKPLNGANDLVFDARGVLYFSDPWRSSLENPIGGFYRAFPDGRLEQLDTGLAFPNGVALAADGSAAYLAETRHSRILRYAIAADGSVGPRTVFATLSGEGGPDGMAFDAAGNLYVAHWGEGRVDVLDPAGREALHIPVPGRNPTNAAFGGPDRRDLVITEVETGSVYCVRMSVPGQPLYSEIG